MNNNVTLYAHKKSKWVKRRVLKEPMISELLNTAKELNEKYGGYHWAFPRTVCPGDYLGLLEREKITQKHIKAYHNYFHILNEGDIKRISKGLVKAINKTKIVVAA